MSTILFSKIFPQGKNLKNITVGTNEVKYVKRGDGVLLYDTLKEYQYGDISINLSYSSIDTPASGGTKKPSLSYSQKKTPIGYSGTTYTATTLTSGAQVTYTLISGDASLSSSGEVTWGNRGTVTGSRRSAVIEVTVKLNNKTNSTRATVYQQENSSSYSYKWKSLSVTYRDADYRGDVITPSITGEQIKVYKYTSGSTKEEDGYIPTTFTITSKISKGTGATIISNSGRITWTANTSTSSRSITIEGTITTAGASQAFSTIAYQEGNEKFYNYSIIIQEENASIDINMYIDDDGDFDLNTSHQDGGIISESNNYIEYNGYSSKSTPSLGFVIYYPSAYVPRYFTVEIIGNGQITTGSYTVYPSQEQRYYYVVKCTGAQSNGTGIIDINIREYY